VVDAQRAPTPRWAWLPAIVSFTLILLAWEWWVRAARVPTYLMPRPTQVWDRALAMGPELAGAAAVTLAEALAGFAIGTLVAIGLGSAMAYSRLAERVLYPIALLIKVTPIVAVAPLFIIWLGFGPAPKVLIAALITFFPTLVNALAGLRAVNPGALDVLRSVAARPWETYWHLRFPSALPYLIAAARVSVPLSLIGAVVGEWWGASDGLGRIIFLANSNIDMPTLFAAVFVLAGLGVLLTWVIGLLERRLLAWHESARSSTM
jgi:ABC-type nitrate/sulfonate/bicarbonate transport system permease component